MARRWLAIGLLAFAALAVLFAADGPLTNGANLPVRTDTNGYLIAAAQTYIGPDGPRRVLANTLLRTDANGYLIVTNPTGFGAPVSAQYWTGAADSTLTAEKNLGVLSTALVINTGGVPSAYGGVTCSTPTFLTALSAVGASTCGSTTEFTTTSTGNIDDLNFSNANLIRVNNASTATIRGLVAGTAGQIVGIVSIGAGNVLLSHQNTSDGTAANRLINTITSADLPLAAGTGTAFYQYDGTTQRWRMLTFEQGAPITPTFSASDYAAATGTWTLQSGDVNTFKYTVHQSGSILVKWDFRTTTTSLATTALEVKLPGGFSTAGTQTSTNWYETSGGSGVTREQASVGTTFAYSIFINISAGGTFPAETNTIGARGSTELLIN